MQITPAAIEAMFYVFDARFSTAYANQETWWQKLATEVPSSTRENRYPWMNKIPRLREWIGERRVNNVAAQAYAIQNKDWELTVEVDKNDIADDQLGQFSQLLDMIGAQAKKWPDNMLVSAMQAGTATLCWDGQYFFDTDHPVDITGQFSSGTWSNNFTSRTLNAVNFEYVRGQMGALLGEDGYSMGIVPTALIVPPQLEGTAKNILNAEFIAPTSALLGNAANVMQSNTNKGAATLIVIPELANEATTWYVADLSKPLKPFIFQLRQPNRGITALTGEKDENVFWRRKYIYGVDTRGNAGFTLPTLIARAIA